MLICFETYSPYVAQGGFKGNAPASVSQLLVSPCSLYIIILVIDIFIVFPLWCLTLLVFSSPGYSFRTKPCFPPAVGLVMESDSHINLSPVFPCPEDCMTHAFREVQTGNSVLGSIAWSPTLQYSMLKGFPWNSNALLAIMSNHLFSLRSTIAFLYQHILTLTLFSVIFLVRRFHLKLCSSGFPT